ncbi:glycoside hydrolase family 125 protein [Terriglobus aquaticus]|uniref:Glycoside hydrolase family 125 protein n=1 Tax=Terriglobus aquaticus TaxID=940139 RepID=A0ABW9KHP0_9BACT|nr:glycoside hydrolase family 125 protein [Terriglobus aquaticus]
MNRRDLLLGASALATTSALSGQYSTAAFSGLSGRPPVAKRRFTSITVERAIESFRTATSSTVLQQTFENCFPNTLDTTVFPSTRDGHPDTYVITGDIDAMWLRDSAAQMWVYLPLTRIDKTVSDLVEGVVRHHARLVLLDPYANAFTRHPGDHALDWALHDDTDMKPGVAERKWEIDSLCYVVRLAHGFWKASNNPAAFDDTWHQAARRIVQTFREQQRKENLGPYHFQRAAANPTDSLPLGGYGNPTRPNGLICSGFRPSDDACIFPQFIPANLFAAVTLDRIAEIASTVLHDDALASEAKSFAGEVRQAVQAHGIIQHPKHGQIYAYEVDGYGNSVAMDDANAPGLASLAYLQLVPQNDPLYQRTRAFALSFDNPYFFRGSAGEGIGGPHIGLGHIWPMAILFRALTSSSDAEITQCLRTLVNTTNGTHFMHESFYKDDPSKYTRPWFAWANGLFGELCLKLQAERPQLLRNFSA